MQEKLRDLMKNEGLKPGQLAEMLGVNPAGISHIMAGRNKPSFEMLQKILRQFPALNPDWLLVDRGPMYRPEPKSEVAAPTSNTANLFDRLPATEPAATDRSQPVSATAAPIAVDASTVKRRPTRIVIFYDDQSFESYAPTNE